VCFTGVLGAFSGSLNENAILFFALAVVFSVFKLISTILLPKIVALIYVALGFMLPIAISVIEGPKCASSALCGGEDGINSSRVAASSLLRFVAIVVFMQSVRIDDHLLEGVPFRVSWIMNTLHAVVARPAQWITGLPLNSLVLPSTTSSQLWLLRTYFTALFYLIEPFLLLVNYAANKARTVVRRRGHGMNAENIGSSNAHCIGNVFSSHNLTLNVPFLAICALSGTWVALATLASSVF